MEWKQQSEGVMGKQARVHMQARISWHVPGVMKDKCSKLFFVWAMWAESNLIHEKAWAR